MDINVDDAYDLLGNHDMPVRQNGLLQALRSLVEVFLQLTGASALVFAAYFAYAWFNDFRETNYKKSVRRKYGIPDDDNDPFNVAYAKVRARQRDKIYLEDDEEPLPAKSASTAQGVASVGGREGADVSLPRRRVVPPSGLTNEAESPNSTASTIGSRPNTAAGRSTHPQMAAPGHSVTPKAKQPDVAARDFAQTSAKQKRPLAEVDETDEHVVPEQAVASSQGIPAEDDRTTTTTAGPSRGWKRQAASDEDISVNGTIGKKAGKRARRQSKKLEEVVNADENGEQMDVDPVARGKKRDRTEAESTFDGDDDLTGSRGRKSRRQKRKSSSTVDVDSATPRRGTKRSFEGESTLGSDDGSKSPRKRGKHMPKEPHDVSPTESSPDASCAGRSIGEQWHANGVTYKVGPDGQRLRQVLLKKRASRFSMPEDSQHPDSRARLEILVETWLNDEEYKTAVKRGEVYTPAKKSKKTEDSKPAPEPGKQLLWAKSQNASRTDGQTPVTPTLTNGKQRVDPFILPGKAKRVPDLESLVESPTGSPGIRQSKSYSKWEKQDLEAEAMARLRKKLEEEKKASTPTSKVSFQTPSSSTGTPASAPSISTSSSAPATFATPSAQAKPVAGTAAPATTSGFTPIVNGNAPKVTPALTQTTTAPSTQPKLPAVVVTPPQPSKAPSPAPPIAIPTFGTKPSGTQPTAASSENKQRTVPSVPAVPVTANGLSTQNTFAVKPQNNTTATPNPFAKPTASSPFSAPVTNGKSADKPSFSFGTTVAPQGDKSAATTPTFSFGKPADKPTSPAPSAFLASAKATPGSGSTTTTFGTGAAQPSAPTTGFSFEAPQNSLGTGSSKPTVGQNVTTGQPSQPSFGTSTVKPNFNFGAAPTSSTPASTNAQTTPAAPVTKPVASAFSFGTNTTATNMSAGNASSASTGQTTGGVSSATAPKFSFGPFTTQPASSTTMPASASSAPKTAFGTPASQATPAITAPTAATSAPKSAFGAPAAQVPASSAPAQPAFTSNASATGPGTAASAPATTGAPASTGFNFGTAKLATPTFSSSPFGNVNNSASSPFNFGAKPAGTSSAPFQFGSASTPSPFGGATNTTTTSTSPFGAPAKPAGEASKPFTFGTSNTTNPFGTAAPPAQNTGSSPFAFGASPTPPGTTAQTGNAAGGPGMFTFGAGPASAFGAPAATATGNMGNNAMQPTSVFGSNTGSSVFGGQKS